jgi:hypothetical protein
MASERAESSKDSHIKYWLKMQHVQARPQGAFRFMPKEP